jgi:predicted RNA-binding Zn-ribbon protein involved in translation (DUF1610 family)
MQVTLSDDKMSESIETVTLRAFDNYFTANLLLTRLRDAGIECYLKDEFTITIDPLLSNALGGIKVIVRKETYPQALAMLKAFDEAAARMLVCPNCGGHNFTLMPKKTAENYTTAVMSWLFSAYAVSAENVYKCDKCGYESESLPEIPDNLTES